MGHLSVVIPPDIVDSVSEGSSSQEGGSIRLACSATGVPPPTVLWRRELNRPIVFRHEGGREKKGKYLTYLRLIGGLCPALNFYRLILMVMTAVLVKSLSESA